MSKRTSNRTTFSMCATNMCVCVCVCLVGCLVFCILGGGFVCGGLAGKWGAGGSGFFLFFLLSFIASML